MSDSPSPSNPLGAAEVARYSRHLTLPEVGVAGQTQLREARVLLIGAGGLGAPLGMYLAAAGVGRIGWVEFDTVELSNLQRQVLFGTSDVGRSKLERACERLAELNPHVHVEPHAVRLDADNALELLGDYDVIVDGTDNFPTRYLVNDACVLLGKPLVYGSIFRFEGQVSLFDARKGPCYRCLYPEPPPAGSVPNCAEGGVLGVLPGIIGTLQATEAIKLIIGQGESLLGRLLLFDALEMRFRELRLRKDPDCPICGERPSIRELRSDPVDCEIARGAVRPGAEDVVDVRQLNELLAGSTPPVLLDVRTAEEWNICRLPGAHHLPLAELAQGAAALDREQDWIVYCRSGVRSERALAWLRKQGFGQVRHLEGGIDAWAREIDPTVPRY